MMELKIGEHAVPSTTIDHLESQQMTSDKREAWTRYYESTVSSRKRREQPRVVRSEQQAPKVLRGAEKAVAEDNAQLRRYRRGKAAEYKAALEGPFGDLAKKAHDILKRITIDDAGVLLTWIDEVEWDKLHPDFSYILLGMVDDTIERMRVQSGLPPFDDSLPGEEPTVFEICRARITNGQDL